LIANQQLMLPSPRPIPSFKKSSELARYVDPDELKSGGRVSSVAFLPNPGDSHLSVNSVEVDSLKNIADYFRSTFKNGSGDVAVACRKINEYNSAGKFAGLSIQNNRSTGKWVYNSEHGPIDAYKHRPTHKSYSHCGVEFINSDVDKLTLKKITRRLAGNRPHLFKL